FVQRALDISRFAGSRQANQQISWKAESRHLASENFVEAIIIARGSEKSAISVKTNGRVRGSVFHKTYHKLCCEMRRIGRAASIAANEQFVSAAQTFFDQIRSLLYLPFEMDE